MAWAVKCPLGVSKAPLRVMPAPTWCLECGIGAEVSFNAARHTARQDDESIDLRSHSYGAARKSYPPFGAQRHPLSGLIVIDLR
jgi:hypothetical protein